MLSQRSISRITRSLTAVGICALLVGCSAKVPDSTQIIEVAQPGPIAVKSDQIIRYGERITGLILDIDDKGNFVGEPVAHLDVASGGRRGLLDMIVHNDRTYASWVNTEDRLTVGEVVENKPVRVIWEGPQAAADHIGGSLTMSSLNRLTLAVGDMQRNPSDTDVEGKIVSLDPDGDASQLPNIISKGWSDPGGITYDPSNKLWVAEGGPDAQITRSGPDGPVGVKSDLSENAGPSDLQLFGTSEMLVCERNTRKLQRFLINNGVEAIPGRKVATDCGGSIAEMKDGRIVYGTDTSLRITSK